MQRYTAVGELTLFLLCQLLTNVRLSENYKLG